MKDVRAVRLVEDALHVLGADEPARHLCPLEEDGLHALACHAVGQRAAGETGADDQDGWQRESLPIRSG
jgi:hypothetical protein